VRVAAKIVEGETGTEAFRAMSGAVDMQRRFPLDTANALRGRLRRENFNIFKRGSKGVTYVCAVRRKFRQPGQSFSETINRLIEFLDQHPMIAVTDLPEQLLGFAAPAPAPAPAATAGASSAATPASAAPPAPATATPAEPEASSAAPPAENAPTDAAPAAPETTATPAEPAVSGASSAAAAEAPAPALTLDQINALNRLMLDLRWLVSEGYVAEYSDGRLMAHPVMAPPPPPKKDAPKDEATEEHAVDEGSEEGALEAEDCPPHASDGEAVGAAESGSDAPASEAPPESVAPAGEGEDGPAVSEEKPPAT
jgi:hypothetical protein